MRHCWQTLLKASDEPSDQSCLLSMRARTEILELERSLAQAQARIEFLEKQVIRYGLARDEQAATIRELEKGGARYKFLTEQHNDWHVERWISGPRGSGTWKSIRGAALDKAIDAALAKEKSDD